MHMTRPPHQNPPRKCGAEAQHHTQRRADSPTAPAHTSLFRVPTSAFRVPAPLLSHVPTFPLSHCVTLLTLAACFLTGCTNQGGAAGRVRVHPDQVHGVWVTRFDYRTQPDVVRVIRDCHEAGFNTVFFQVRGYGTAFYDSKIEPWAEELGGRHPGFDPLEVACTEAHRLGLSLHAYVNVMPAWRGTGPPRNPKQLYNARPDWFWYDQHGKRQTLQSFYVSLNPCLPQVRQYLTAVCHEIVTRYDVDGLHLDYIRFPNEPPAATGGADYPRDRQTLSLFMKDTNRHPDSDPQLWTRWRNDRVTDLVRDIHQMVKRAKPNILLSAAVGPDPSSHYRTHYQDSIRWMNEGLLDFVTPMNYTTDDRVFFERNQEFLKHRRRCAVAPGILVEPANLSNQATIAHVRRKLDICRNQTGAFCLFAYSSLFDPPTSQSPPQKRAERAERRQALIPYLRSLNKSAPRLASGP